MAATPEDRPRRPFGSLSAVLILLLGLVSPSLAAIPKADPSRPPSPEVVARYRSLGEEGRKHLARRDAERAAAAFAEMESLVPSSAEGPYLLAGALAQTGDLEGSTRALARAILSDFDDARSLEFDAALRPLREDPRFRVMVLGAEAKALELARGTAAGAAPGDLPSFDSLAAAQSWGQGLRKQAEGWSALQYLGEFRRLRWRALDAHRYALEKVARGAPAPVRAEAELAAIELLGEYRDPPEGWELEEALRRLEAFRGAHEEHPLLPRAQWLELHLRRRALPALSSREERERLGRELASQLARLVATEEEAGRTETAGLALLDLVALEAGREGGDPGPPLARLQEGYAESESLWTFAREREAALMLRLTGVPPFEAADLEGSPRGSASLEGKIALIDFWATWCPPCVAQIPELAALQRQTAGEKRFLILGISLDAREEMEEESFRGWLEDKGVTWPQIRDGEGDLSPLVRAFGVETVPFQVLVGADGSVLEAGPRVPLHRIRAAIESLP